jgi:hypothetical protein
VLIIATTIGNSCVDTGHFAPCLLAIARSLFLLGKATLRDAQLLLIPCEEFGIANSLAIRGHDHRLEAQVQPNDLVACRMTSDLSLHAQRDEIAASRIFRDDHGGDRGSLWQGTRLADIQRLLHLGQSQDLAIPGKGTLGILSRLLVVAGFELGIASPALKEVGEGIGQVAQALLEGNAGDFVEEGGFWLLFEQRQPLRQVIGRETALRLFIGVDAQAQRPIVDVAHTAEGACQNLLLGSRWVKAVLVRTFLLAHRLVALSLFLEMLFESGQDFAIERAMVLFGCLAHLLQETFRKPDGKCFHVIFHRTSIMSYCNYVKRLGPHSLAPNKQRLRTETRPAIQVRVGRAGGSAGGGSDE